MLNFFDMEKSIINSKANIICNAFCYNTLICFSYEKKER